MEKYSEAIKFYKETFKYESPEAITHYYIGESYEQLNNLRKAMHHYNKSIELNDTLADAWAGLGRIMVAQDNDTSAIKYFEKAIDIMPSNNEFIFDLSMIYLRREDFPKSAAGFKKVTENDVFNIEAWINQSSCHYAMDDIDSAIEIIEDALNDNKTNALLWYRLAGYLHLSGKVQQAYYYIESALKIDPEQHTELLELIPELLMDPRFIELLGVYKDNS
jgi:predicted Zn-dependent protease